MSPNIEPLIRITARVFDGDPDRALAIVAKAARDGKRQVTLPKSWSARPWRITVFPQTGALAAERINQPAPDEPECSCGPDCDRHAPF
jgi:hypothetical protein